MNHNKIIKFCLKYFNITLGILMVIVLSLNIELIFHNKRIEKTSFNNKNTSLLNSNGEPLNFTKFFNNNIDFFDKCVNCSREAINLMTRLNVYGSLLSVFLIAYSFLFAYKINFFVEHHKWLIPICAITQILTFLYFIFAISAELPIVCASIIKRIEKEFNCDADIEYNLENKLIPLSVLMLVLIPQFFVRSVSVLLIKYIYKENRVKAKFLYNNFYTQRTSMVLEENDKAGTASNSPNLGNSSSSLTESFKSSKRKNRKSSNNKEDFKSSDQKLLPPLVFPEQDDIMQSMHQSMNSPNLIAFRELPVDCPILTYENPKMMSHHGEELSIIEKARREADLAEQYDNLKRILSSNSIDKEDLSDEIILKDGNNNTHLCNANLSDNNQPEMTLKANSNLRLTSIIASTKRFFARNSSLSTISEEKSMNTLSPNSFKSFPSSNGDVITSNSDTSSTSVNNTITDENTTLTSPYNGLQVVQTMLNEFQHKNLLISEILQVFEPSSKKGTFNRNIPIRLSNIGTKEESITSTKNKFNLSPNESDIITSPLTPLYTSALTSIDAAVTNQGFYNDLKMFLESSSSLLTSYYASPNNPRLNAKKTRLLKRLKNRIETKRGRSFSEPTKKAKQIIAKKSIVNDEDKESQSSVKQRIIINRKSSPESANVYSRINNFRGSLLSFEKVRRFDTQDLNLNEMFSINQSINVTRNNNRQLNIEPNSSRSSTDTTLILDKNIKPAYF